MKPVKVAVFFSSALASLVANRLNAELASGDRIEDYDPVEADGDDEDDASAQDFHGVTVQAKEHPAAAHDYDTEFEPLGPAEADKLLDAIVASKTAEVADDVTAVEEVAPSVDAAVAEVAAPRGEPNDADWADAFLAVEGGSDMADVAATLGVSMPKLRGRYVAWKGAKKKAAAKPVAAVVTPIAPLPPVSAPQDEPKPFWWRDLTDFLGNLGYRGGWSASLDLALVEGLASGKQLEVVADEIGKEFGEAKARFIALTPAGVSIDGQARLLQVLRARAGVLK